MPEDIPDYMPENIPNKIPNRMSKDMSNKISENLPIKKYINGIIRILYNKIYIYFKKK